MKYYAPTIEEQKTQLNKLLNKSTITPQLMIITDASDEASDVYIKQKIKKGAYFGITVYKQIVGSKEELLYYINLANNKPEIHGIIVQLPLQCVPQNELYECLNTIAPEKDVDGLTVTNIGLLQQQNKPFFYPCTPLGITLLMDYHNIDIQGKLVAILGRSNLVGRPLAKLLEQKGATTVLLHTNTTQSYKEALVYSADIVVTATGNREVIDWNVANSSSTFIDVGIHRTDSGVCGDITFTRDKFNDTNITAVPGGVGVMTVYSLLYNVTVAALRSQGVDCSFYYDIYFRKEIE